MLLVSISTAQAQKNIIRRKPTTAKKMIHPQKKYQNRKPKNNSFEKIYNFPPVLSRYDGSLTVISVMIKHNETILTLSCKNDLEGGWMNIDRNAYITANGRRYSLTGKEGIAFAPNYTYFSYPGESKKFKLHFQPIPPSTSSIDFIESTTSVWRIYGIRLK